MRKIVLILLFIALVFFDLLSKKYAEFWLSDVFYHPLLGEWFGFRLSYNTGIAFSLPVRGLLLQGITILLILMIFFQYIREEYKKNMPALDIGYVLILAGALSHAYERIMIGHVVDFIAVKYFAILNIADIFISLGAFLLIFIYVRTRKKQ